LGAALDVRGIKSADNLIAQVEGDIEDVNGVMRITKIRLQYRFQVPVGSREKVDRLLAGYAEQCPAYQSVKGCIECSWAAEIEEG
jgi:organic hydroperoxide reductase OsmC/OhrA